MSEPTYETLPFKVTTTYCPMCSRCSGNIGPHETGILPNGKFRFWCFRCGYGPEQESETMLGALGDWIALMESDYAVVKEET